jgi:hypothetical protein
MTLTFNTEIKSELYTTQLKLNHSKSSNEVISGAVDLFKVTDDTNLPIDDQSIERIFTTSKSFFENQFIEILNIGL